MGQPFSISVEIKSVAADARTNRGLKLAASTSHAAAALSEHHPSVSFGRVKGAINPTITVEFLDANGERSHQEAKLTVSGSFLIEGLIAGLENGTFALTDDQRQRLFAHFLPKAANSIP